MNLNATLQILADVDCPTCNKPSLLIQITDESTVRLLNNNCRCHPWGEPSRDPSKNPFKATQAHP